jgi:8-oxo-dGTP pyrophosphatase MutT (NUDIX family)
MLGRRLLSTLVRANRLRVHLTQPLTLGVRVILEQDAQVLLVEHRAYPGWYLPGGGVDRGETLVQAARREAYEETGARLRDLRLFGAYSSTASSRIDHIVVFLSRDFALAPPPRSLEIARRGLFDLSELPEDISRGCARRLGELGQQTDGPRAGAW